MVYPLKLQMNSSARPVFAVDGQSVWINPKTGKHHRGGTKRLDQTTHLAEYFVLHSTEVVAIPTLPFPALGGFWHESRLFSWATLSESYMGLFLKQWSQATRSWTSV